MFYLPISSQILETKSSNKEDVDWENKEEKIITSGKLIIDHLGDAQNDSIWKRVFFLYPIF